MANNQYVNKVIFGNDTILDISEDTVVSSALLSGYTAHAGSGASISGSILTKTSSDLTASGLTVTVPSGYYGTTATKTLTDNNLIAANIKDGVTIFGVTGTLVEESGVAAILQEKTNITPTESSQIIEPDNGYNGLSSVQINAISSTYVGSGITSRSSTDLSANGDTVTVPAGYYASQATKTVSSLVLPTSVSSSATNGYTSKATISRSTSDQYINIGTGYNSAGGYYKISAVANGSATGPTSLSGSSATLSTGTNTITLTKTGITTTPTVSAGYVSTATASTATVALTASVTTKAAATITPGTSDQTIASGTYLTGTQTISGDADLTAANIKVGVGIFGVTGTYTSDATADASKILSGETAYVNGSKLTGSLVITTVYVGSAAPSASTGINGDIYIQS